MVVLLVVALTNTGRRRELIPFANSSSSSSSSKSDNSSSNSQSLIQSILYYVYECIALKSHK